MFSFEGGSASTARHGTGPGRAGLLHRRGFPDYVGPGVLAASLPRFYDSRPRRRAISETFGLPRLQVSVSVTFRSFQPAGVRTNSLV